MNDRYEANSILCSTCQTKRNAGFNNLSRRNEKRSFIGI